MKDARERLIISELLFELTQIYGTPLQRRGISLETIFIIPLLYRASLSNRAVTINSLVKATNIPRTTVVRRLQDLIRHGTIERDGHFYRVTANALERPVSDTRRAVQAITRACNELVR